MTQEQYNRAVEINSRLANLEDVKKYISEAKLYYKSQYEHSPLFDFVSAIINEKITFHDSMIRAEIDEEIEKLKKEIEEL